MTAESFFKELNRLISEEPKQPTHQVNCENCEHGDHNYYCKNLLYSFDCVKCADGTYLYDCVLTTQSIDCDYVIESELCYNSVDSYKCFNSNFLEDCANISESSYSAQCSNCQNVFGCVLLQNKSYCIFNRQLTQAQYEEEIKKYNAWSPEKVLAAVEELKMKYPLTQTHENNNENSSYGDFVYYNKNCYLCFDTARCIDTCYAYDCGHDKSSLDLTYSAENELSYELVDSAYCFNTNYTVFSAHIQDSSYIFNCTDVKNCLGVVGKEHKQYIILNRQFGKEDYEKISKEILEDIKTKNLGWDSLVYI
jgi:hypothetical protein